MNKTIPVSYVFWSIIAIGLILFYQHIQLQKQLQLETDRFIYAIIERHMDLNDISIEDIPIDPDVLHEGPEPTIEIGTHVTPESTTPITPDLTEIDLDLCERAASYRYPNDETKRNRFIIGCRRVL